MLNTRIISGILRKRSTLSLSTFKVFDSSERAREEIYIRQEEKKIFEELRARKKKLFSDELKMITNKNPTPITMAVFEDLLDWKFQTSVTEGGTTRAPCFQHEDQADHIRSREDVNP